MVEMTREEMRDRLGNIEQIRTLLFGRQIEDYEQRFSHFQQHLEKLAGTLSGFEQEMRDRLGELQESLRSETRSTADSLEKKLKYLSLTTHEETSKLQQEIGLVDQKHTSEIESLQRIVTDRASALSSELLQTREKLEEDTEALKKQVFAEIEQRFADLENAKVARADLAEVLFEICLKIKGADFVPDLKEAAENMQTDFILPEQQE
ncbi:MAG: hypothetical protein ACFB4I_19960 [Cyanophyceae cyanobacterium]